MPDPLNLLRGAVQRVSDDAAHLRAIARSGMLAPELPHRLIRMALEFERYGTVGALAGIAATRYGDGIAVIDERGPVTYRELDRRSNAIANAWIARGLRAGDGVAVLARNHRGFLDAVLAAGKCGARIVLLNTDFAGPQLREVAQREGTDLLVHDDEYSGLLEGVAPPRGRFRAWTDEPGGADTLEALIHSGRDTAPPRPGAEAKVILLTSGTTGTPKGAPRSDPRSISALGGLLQRVPFRTREVTELPAPMFHTLGFAHALLGLGLGSTLVIRRRFDPETVLASIERHRPSAMVAVPVMLQRLVDHGVTGHDVGSLRIIFVAGSQLGAELCVRATQAFGPVLYNMYGSTEVAYATLADPQQLALEPGSVGTPIPGALVRIVDDAGRPVPPGVTGRIFVGNKVQFEGYTGGGSKQVIDGLMSSGDVGHFDEHGFLFVDGRDDDMIVSGGENVFPGEVEEKLASHPAVAEAAAIGVPDETFGQRLRAYVVVRPGRTVTEDELKDYIRANLARYKTPRDVVFVDALPRNPTGKVLKRQLREMPTP
jgi:fatty-acyl-CoA synthase